MNVINTINPGIILKTIKDIKKKRDEKKEGETPIVISKFFAERLKSFETIVPDLGNSGIHNIFKVKLSFPLLIFLERIPPMQHLPIRNKIQPCQAIL